MSENKPKVLVGADEEERVGRALLLWLNTWPEKPVARIDFEDLPADGVGMSVSTIQAAFKTRQFIDGSYEAQYQFKVIYRLQPGDNESRLAADEALNRLGAWAERNPVKPSLGENVLVRRVQRDSIASLYGTYADGSRDHQILMNLLYEVR